MRVITRGAIANVSSTTSFVVLFLANAVSFVLFALVVVVRVPRMGTQTSAKSAAAPARYRNVITDRAFVTLVVINVLLVAAGAVMFGSILPLFALRTLDQTEALIGVLFFVNTMVVVVAQLPAMHALAGLRRMPVLAGLSVLWAACWAVVALLGATDTTTAGAGVLLCLVAAVFAVGELGHGAVLSPLVADLAPPPLLGRYMAVLAFSWQIGLTVGPVLGSLALRDLHDLTWLLAAGACVAAAVLALAVEPRLPEISRRAPAT